MDQGENKQQRAKLSLNIYDLSCQIASVLFIVHVESPTLSNAMSWLSMIVTALSIIKKKDEVKPFLHALADSCVYFNVLSSEMVRCCFVDTDPDAHGRQIIRLGLIPQASPPHCPDQTLP